MSVMEIKPAILADKDRGSIMKAAKNAINDIDLTPKFE
jgi:hypothetical protein